jgi:hypothetical protein
LGPLLAWREWAVRSQMLPLTGWRGVIDGRGGAHVSSGGFGDQGSWGLGEWRCHVL